jgi:hypothetical protein
VESRKLKSNLMNKTLTRRKVVSALACAAPAAIAAGVACAKGGVVMNAIDKIDTRGARRASLGADVKLLDLFEKYQAALVEDHEGFRRHTWNSRRKRSLAALRRAYRLHDQILATPAESVAGIAVKLATSSGIVLRPCGNRNFDGLNEPVRSALDDALRLAGLNLVMDEKPIRTAAQPLPPRKLVAA